MKAKSYAFFFRLMKLFLILSLLLGCSRYIELFFSFKILLIFSVISSAVVGSVSNVWTLRFVWLEESLSELDAPSVKGSI